MILREHNDVPDKHQHHSQSRAVKFRWNLSAQISLAAGEWRLMASPKLEWLVKVNITISLQPDFIQGCYERATRLWPRFRERRCQAVTSGNGEKYE